MSGSGGLDADVAAVRASITALIEEHDTKPVSPTRRRALDAQIRLLIEELEQSLAHIDPIVMPTAVFDPSDPKVIGRFTALAMIAQPKRPLASIGKFYGSGIYALYYAGSFPIYSPLSGTETPIYVGKAGPAIQGARTAREQGARLAGRLADHRKNIAKADSTLNIEDFGARFLVVQSGWETAAEDHLIHLFQPLWNNETNVLYGLGKHCDSAAVRANKRSPWDSLHPGRAWAANTKEDARSNERISADVEAHFHAHPPVRDAEALLEAFFEGLRQR